MISFSGFVMYVMGYELTSFSLSVKSLTIAGVNWGMDQRASGGKPPVSVAYFRASAFCSSVGACVEINRCRAAAYMLELALPGGSRLEVN